MSPPFLPELSPLVPVRDQQSLREIHQVHKCFGDLGGDEGNDEHWQGHHGCPGASLEPWVGDSLVSDQTCWGYFPWLKTSSGRHLVGVCPKLQAGPALPFKKGFIRHPSQEHTQRASTWEQDVGGGGTNLKSCLPGELVLRTAELIKVTLQKEQSWAVPALDLEASGKRRVTETPGRNCALSLLFPQKSGSEIFDYQELYTRPVFLKR